MVPPTTGRREEVEEIFSENSEEEDSVPDLPDISEGENAGLPAQDVANLSNPVPDVRRHSPGDHVEVVSPTLSQDTNISCVSCGKRKRI